jgi:hypothetical protein
MMFLPNCCLFFAAYGQGQDFICQNGDSLKKSAKEFSGFSAAIYPPKSI